VNAMTEAVMRNRAARQSARDAPPRGAQAAQMLPKAQALPQAPPKRSVVPAGVELRRSKPRDVPGPLYVTWAVEPCDADPEYGGGGACKDDAKPGQLFSRQPRVVRLMMLKRWALSVRRADPTARVMVLTDLTTVRARWVTLRARWVTLRARWVTLRARWVTLRARWVTLRARWVTLRARWATLRARWVTLRARWVTLRARWVTLRARWVPRRARG
jgi:hypothetical protein